MTEYEIPSLTERIPITFTGFRHFGYYSPNSRYRPESEQFRRNLGWPDSGESIGFQHTDRILPDPRNPAVLARSRPVGRDPAVLARKFQLVGGSGQMARIRSPESGLTGFRQRWPDSVAGFWRQ